MTSLLEVRDLGKHFGSTIALRQLSLEVAQGEIRALLGENGAGKSTFVKLLSGLIRPDRGEIRLEGRDYQPTSPVQARERSVATAYQELSLVPYHDVAENFFVGGALGKHHVYRRKAARASTRAILDEFGIQDIEVGAKAGALSLAQQQRLEIARTLHSRPRLLILDEPTAALPDPEWLYGYVEQLAASGTAVLFISHRLAEVRRLCQSVTVLRGGESVYTNQLSAVTDDELFEAMVGRSLGRTLAADAVSRPEPNRAATPVLKVKGFEAGEARVEDLAVAPGEIVGIAALEGQGQKDLFSGIAGVSNRHHGSLEIAGTAIDGRGIVRRLKAGLVYVPEERKTEGILQGLTTEANISISTLRDVVGYFGLVDAKKERERVAAAADLVDINREYLARPIERLSGGNQQKALLARALMTTPQCLLLFDPTRGVDVGTKETMYAVMERFAERGGGILFYSTDLQELVRFAHRVAVMYRGHIVGEMKGEEIREERLVRAMCGYAESEEVRANVVA